MFLERGLAIEDGGGGEVAVATEKGAGAIEIGFPRPREGETPSDGGTDVRGWEGGGPHHTNPHPPYGGRRKIIVIVPRSIGGEQA